MPADKLHRTVKASTQRQPPRKGDSIYTCIMTPAQLAEREARIKIEQERIEREEAAIEERRKKARAA